MEIIVKTSSPGPGYRFELYDNTTLFYASRHVHPTPEAARAAGERLLARFVASLNESLRLASAAAGAFSL